MTFEVVDRILAIYLDALAQGLGRLQDYTLGILAIFALLAFVTHMIQAEPGGGTINGLLYGVLPIGVTYWISVSLAAMAIAAFDTFVQFGSSTSGGLTTLMVPSTVWAYGWNAAKPLLKFAMKFDGWMTILASLFDIAIAYICAGVLIVAFGVMAFFVMLVQIEFRISLMLAAVIVPLAVYQATAFMAEFGIGLLCGGLIRAFFTTALMALSSVLTALLVPQIGPGGDPTFETGIVMAFVGGSYIALLITVARKASSMAVRGLGLGIGGEGMTLRNLTRAASYTLGPLGRASVGGVSRLLRSRA